jgi:S-formylglutathione hydrolase FrmB
MFLCYFLAAFAFASVGDAFQSEVKAQPVSLEIKQGTVVTETLVSTILRANKVGLDPNRKVKIYLPSDYFSSGKSYPVVYYCHTVFTNPDKVMEESNIAGLLDKAFEKGIVKQFIFVLADYSTKAAGSFYENSVVSGQWLDFTAKELVPFIDGKFRTLRSRNSRALVGNYMGGRGALKLAMEHPELFSVVYALHPVATGTGYQPWSASSGDWKKILNAKSADGLGGDFIVGLNQAFLPNLNRPPFYCDFFMELENGEPKLHVENTEKAQAGFLLDRGLSASAANLRSMRGIAFDWGRYDPVQDHIYSARAFAGKLEDLGIEHEAEEYRGNPFNKIWSENGRFYTRLIPFLSRHLVFESEK